MKTFKQFIEAPKKPMGPSKTPATDSTKIKHDSQRDAHADRSRLDKEKQSTDFQRMVSTQKSEIERAKKSDKSAGLRKATADKIKKQQVAAAKAAADKRKKQQAKKK